jgi:hypothetical protein
VYRHLIPPSLEKRLPRLKMRLPNCMDLHFTPQDYDTSSVGFCPQDCDASLVGLGQEDFQIDDHFVINCSIGIVADLEHSNKDQKQSPAYLKWYTRKVRERSLNIGGKQRIKTSDRSRNPFSLQKGLPCVKMRPSTDIEPTDCDFYRNKEQE